MRLTILIGGRAGQGINRISGIVSSIFIEHGYYTFNYRDYPSLIRGGHNFNILSISDEKIESHEVELDGIVAMDENTVEVHKSELKKDGFIIPCDNFLEFGMNLNIALAGALMNILGLDRQSFLDKIKLEMKGNPDSMAAAEKGFDSEKKRFDLKKFDRKLHIMNGAEGIVQGAVNSNIDLYFGYPMTPSSPTLHEMAAREFKDNFMVYQPEDEISVINAALGASFAGARVMIGTAGGGFNLFTEGISLQGQSELPLVAMLASRPGPGTGLPTYTSQGDLFMALRCGHGEFPRVVIAPGTPLDCIEKTNEAFYLAQKHGVVSIILTDKHLQESEFAFNELPKKPFAVKVERKVPGEAIAKATSYEHDEHMNTVEDAETPRKNNERRIKRYKALKEDCSKLQMIKFHGNLESKNLIVCWGSTVGAIKDAVQGQDYKILQVIYMKPMSDAIRQEIQNARKVILIEQNLTGQLGRVIREKTGIKIQNRILKHDGRPFTPNEIQMELAKFK